MKSLFLCLYFFSFSLFSITLDAQIDSSNVEEGELFDVVFRVGVDSDVKPRIEYDEFNLELVDMEDEGVSSSVTYINGEVTKKVEYVLRYTFKALKGDRASLKNIYAKVQGDKARTRDLEFRISGVSVEKSRDVFVRAETTKKDVYVGEGILLKYFLYYKVNVSNYNILGFPKLKGFMKRFFKERDYKEVVDFQGERFNRIHLYSAVIYPEKEGSFNVDSMNIEVTSPTGRGRRSLFGGFGNIGRLGLGFGGQKKKRYSSEPVEIKVKPLPLEGRPLSFTGLVGKHDFSLKIAKNKLIVNEPLEVKFAVKGEGNLESYDGPAIFTGRAFEEFERNSKLQISKTVNAEKKYNYTFIVKSSDAVINDELELSIFNPDSKMYEVKKISIPTFQIVNASGVTSSKSSTSTEFTSKKVINKVERKILAPTFGSSFLDFSFHKVFNGFLLLLIVLFLLQTILGNVDIFSIFLNKELSMIKSDYLEFGALYKFLAPINNKEKDLVGKIKKSKLSANAQSYFENLIEIISSKDYGQSQSTRNLKFKKKFFKEVVNIKNEKNE